VSELISVLGDTGRRSTEWPVTRLVESLLEVYVPRLAPFEFSRAAFNADIPWVVVLQPGFDDPKRRPGDVGVERGAGELKRSEPGHVDSTPTSPGRRFGSSKPG
jgi:hypothetical protein